MDFFVPEKHFSMVSGDRGKAYRNHTDIKNRIPLSRRQRKKKNYQQSLRAELHKKEKALAPKEYEEYMDSISYLGHISEKIYYLNLPSFERKKYVEGKKLREQRIKEKNRGIPLLKMKEFGRGEIHPGMNKKMVLEKWGRPMRVDVAGDPVKQNERWSFYHGGQLRHIYFEGGVVQGWRMERE